MISAAEVRQKFFMASLTDASLHKRPTVAIDMNVLMYVFGPAKRLLLEGYYDGR